MWFWSGDLEQMFLKFNLSPEAQREGVYFRLQRPAVLYITVIFEVCGSSLGQRLELLKSVLLNAWQSLYL